MDSPKQSYAGDMTIVPSQGPCVCVYVCVCVCVRVCVCVSGELRQWWLWVSRELGQVRSPLSFLCLDNEVRPFFSVTWLLRNRVGFKLRGSDPNPLIPPAGPRPPWVDVAYRGLHAPPNFPSPTQPRFYWEIPSPSEESHAGHTFPGREQFSPETGREHNEWTRP